MRCCRCIRVICLRLRRKIPMAGRESTMPIAAKPHLQRRGQHLEVPPPQILVVRAREQVPPRRVQQQRADAANVAVERGHAVHRGQAPDRRR
jgi:hypothetical protein